MEKNKKNFLFVINSLKIWWWAEKIVADVWTKLYESWFNIYYFTFYDSKELYNFKWKYFSLKEKKGASGIFNLLFKLIKRNYIIYKFSKKNKIDIIISSWIDNDISCFFVKIFLNIKIFFWVHLSINNLAKRHRLFVKYFYIFADKIITIVKEENNNLINNFWIKKS